MVVVWGGNRNSVREVGLIVSRVFGVFLVLDYDFIFIREVKIKDKFEGLRDG